MEKEKECGYYDCGMTIKEILLTVDNGNEKVVLCLNHAVVYTLEEYSLENIETAPSDLKKPLTTCDACGEKSTVLYETSGYNFEQIGIELCQEDLTRLIQNNLTQAGYTKLRGKFGIFHEIHDDFYDDRGYALQPMVEE